MNVCIGRLNVCDSEQVGLGIMLFDHIIVQSAAYKLCLYWRPIVGGSQWL